MTLFPLAAIILKFNRGRLQRDTRTPLALVLVTLAGALAIIGGNVAIDPTTIG